MKCVMCEWQPYGPRGLRPTCITMVINKCWVKIKRFFKDNIPGNTQMFQIWKWPESNFQLNHSPTPNTMKNSTTINCSFSLRLRASRMGIILSLGSSFHLWIAMTDTQPKSLFPGILTHSLVLPRPRPTRSALISSEKPFKYLKKDIKVHLSLLFSRLDILTCLSVLIRSFVEGWPPVRATVVHNFPEWSLQRPATGNIYLHGLEAAHSREGWPTTLLAPAALPWLMQLTPQ